MVYSSRGLALLLSVCIALTLTLLLFSFEGLDIPTRMVVVGISFISSFILIYYAIEYLFFREIRKINKLIEKLRNNSFQETGNRKAGVMHPLQTIHSDIHSFAESKQKEIDQLKKLEAFRREFIADISHELKTPIFAAQGFVHTLLDGAVDEKAVRKKFLRKAAKSLDGLDVLVQDLLTLSHIETGQIKMRFQEIDLYALTQEVIEQFKGESNKKEVSLRIEGAVRKVLVYADWQRITQVMTNLISNAVKHSDEDGEVVVTFNTKKKSVVTRVTDFGEGIPDEHINRIFERFYRVDKSRSREKGGTGLGLAIVKHILEGHQSKPEVESAPGKGSTFSFKLPRIKTEMIEDAEPQEPAKD